MKEGFTSACQTCILTEKPSTGTCTCSFGVHVITCMGILNSLLLAVPVSDNRLITKNIYAVQGGFRLDAL